MGKLISTLVFLGVLFLAPDGECADAKVLPMQYNYLCRVSTKWSAQWSTTVRKGESYENIDYQIRAESEAQAFQKAQGQLQLHLKSYDLRHGKNISFSAANGACWISGKPRPSKPLGWNDQFNWYV